MEIQRSYKPGGKTNMRSLSIFIICALFFSIMTVITAENKHPAFDQLTYDFFASWMGPIWMPVLEIISLLASKPGIIGISIFTVLILWLKKKDYAGMLTMLIFVFGGNVVNKLVKEWVQRERPLLDGVIVEGYSFPSGHAMVGLIMYGLIVYFIYHHSLSALFKTIVLYMVIFLMGMIGISRFVLREHYVTDVLAGYSLGGMMLIMAIAFYQRVHKK